MSNARAIVDHLFEAESPLQHGDIVRFKDKSPYRRPGYWRVDIEDAIGAKPEKPWIGKLADNSGFYVEAQELLLVASVDEFDTASLQTDEEVDDALDALADEDDEGLPDSDSRATRD